MKISKIARAMGHIDDDLIAAAEEYKPVVRKKYAFRLRYAAALVAACIVLVLAIGIIRPYTGSYTSTTSVTTLPSPGDPAASQAHFYFGGKAYVFFGEYTDTLPEGFTLVGETKTEGYVEGESAEDFAGNVQGEVYISESDKTVAYIKRNYGEKYWKMEAGE